MLGSFARAKSFTLTALPLSFMGLGVRGRSWTGRLLVVAAGAIAAYALSIGLSFAAQGKTADFHAFLNGAAAAAGGSDLYADGSGYIYPPLLAVFLRPLLWLPPHIAAAVWVVAQWALMIAAAVFSAELAQSQAGPDSRRAPAILIASAAYLILGDKIILELRDGNCDAVIIWCWLLALWGIGRRPVLTGACIGLAVNIKYTAIVLLPYLIVARRWREAAWAFVWIVLLALLPALSIGWPGNAAAWSQAIGGLSGLFTGRAPDSAASVHPLTWELSVSLSSAFSRVFASAGFPAGTGLFASGLFALAIALAMCWGYACFSVPMPWSMARRSLPNRDLLAAVEWWGLLAATLVFSPQTPTRHLNMAMPLVALAAALAVSAPAGRRRLMQYAALAGMGAALWLPPSSDWTHEWVHAWRIVGGPCAALLVLTWATAILALSECRRAVSPARGRREGDRVLAGPLRSGVAIAGRPRPEQPTAVPHHANPPRRRLEDPPVLHR